MRIKSFYLTFQKNHDLESGGKNSADNSEESTDDSEDADD